jgi:cytochrome c
MNEVEQAKYCVSWFLQRHDLIRYNQIQRTIKQTQRRIMGMKYIKAMGVAALLFASPAWAEGDAALGAKVFNKCKTCHENEKGVNRVGPTLKGVVGRKTASVEGFKYSEAMAKKGAEGQVWDDATLTSYITDPKGFIPGNKMAFPGIKNADELANLIAFLKTKP